MNLNPKVVLCSDCNLGSCRNQMARDREIQDREEDLRNQRMQIGKCKHYTKQYFD